jgi:hypothetical protein
LIARQHLSLVSREQSDCTESLYALHILEKDVPARRVRSTVTVAGRCSGKTDKSGYCKVDCCSETCFVDDDSYNEEDDRDNPGNGRNYVDEMIDFLRDG